MARMDWEGARRRDQGRNGEPLNDTGPPASGGGLKLRATAVRNLRFAAAQAKAKRWRMARQYLGVARRAYQQMHPKESAAADVTRFSDPLINLVTLHKYLSLKATRRTQELPVLALMKQTDRLLADRLDKREGGMRSGGQAAKGPAVGHAGSISRPRGPSPVGTCSRCQLQLNRLGKCDCADR